jgi:hypothetical protein
MKREHRTNSAADTRNIPEQGISENGLQTACSLYGVPQVDVLEEADVSVPVLLIPPSKTS